MGSHIRRAQCRLKALPLEAQKQGQVYLYRQCESLGVLRELGRRNEEFHEEWRNILLIKHARTF
jgi:hypothetical protein